MSQQLKRFKHIREFVNQSDFIDKLKVDFIRLSDDKWIDHAEIEITNAQMCSALTSTRGSPKPFRPKNSKKAFFFIEKFDFIAAIEFDVPPTKNKMNRFLHQLKEGIRHAESEFDSMHDPMTGLHNSTRFLPKVKIFIDTLNINSAVQATPEYIPLPPIIGMIAIDIDHFKQVNDTYGHMYGDIVIKSLANRLHHYSEEHNSDSLRLYPIRLGGEEFVILVVGRIDAGELFELGDRLRLEIEESTLPSDEDIELFGANDSQLQTTPNKNKRHLTISAGVSSTSLTNGSSQSNPSNFDSIFSTLRHKSDKALYCAKQCGRNKVCVFTEILEKYGRILEHHEATDVVVIDLGRSVGVTRGHEFLVFHPNFDGTKPFTRNDGRTVKTLGIYPRKSVGRVVVVDVQQDISFCRVAESRSSTLFPEGSSLEVIPIGTISHLLPTVTFGAGANNVNLSPIDDLENVINSADSPSECPMVIAFGLDRVDSLVKDYGTSSINESLSILIQIIHETIGIRCKVAQAQDTEFVALVIDTSSDALSLANQIIEKASNRLNGLVTFSGGTWSFKTPGDSFSFGDKSILTPEFSLDYARFALANAAKSGNKIEVFNSSVAHQLIRDQYLKNLYRKVLADYTRFCEIGIDYFNIHNIAAISAFKLGASYYDTTKSAIQKARDLHPSRVIIANMATFEFELDRRQAFRTFKDALAIPSNDPLFPEAKRCYALSAYEELLHDGDITAHEVLELLESVDLNLIKNQKIKDELLQAINVLKNNMSSSSESSVETSSDDYPPL